MQPPLEFICLLHLVLSAYPATLSIRHFIKSSGQFSKEGEAVHYVFWLFTAFCFLRYSRKKASMVNIIRPRTLAIKRSNSMI
jgi:hypothetical protein